MNTVEDSGRGRDGGEGEKRASIFDRRDETGFYGKRVASSGERGDVARDRNKYIEQESKRRQVSRKARDSEAVPFQRRKNI